MAGSAPSRIPVFVLTGFLGSGKTSLLNLLLKDPAFADSAVIVNEFGEIGLDHLLAASAKDSTILLDSGCLCCAMGDSLKQTLLDLHHRGVRGEIPDFKRILIETSGVADPGPILQQVTRDSVISYFYRLGGLVCTVDALFGEAQLAEHAEAAAQAAMADWLVVTKTDLTGDACPSALAGAVSILNPTAEIQLGHAMLGARLAAGRQQSSRLPWLNDISREIHRHGESDLHDAAITSECFWLDEPVSWAGLAAWIEWLRQSAGPDLLRCKGLVNVAGAGGPVVLHGVRDRFETTRLDIWPDDERRSRLVLIGRKLRRPALRAGLDWLTAAEGSHPVVAGQRPPGQGALWTARE